jgi:hypothetical protein
VTGYYTARQVPAADPDGALVITADGKTSGNAGGKGNSKRMAELVCVDDPRPDCVVLQ